MAKSIIFLTTPSSATASIWRILSTIASKSNYMLNRYTDSFYLSNTIDNIKTSIPPENDNIILFNTPDFFNEKIDLSNYKFILNIRDPRDILCNQYFWSMQHLTWNNDNEKLEENRKNISIQSIDNFVLNKKIDHWIDPIVNVFNRTQSEDRILATYALLCIDFDSYISKLANFLEIDLSNELKESLSIERPENLVNNSQWIGNQWKNADIHPGRFISELKKETATILKERYSIYLNFLAQNDDAKVQSTYV